MGFSAAQKKQFAEAWAGPLTDEELAHVERERRLSGAHGDATELTLDDLERVRGELKTLINTLTESIRERLQGDGTRDVFFALLQGIISGEHVYVEGSSGTAKTYSMRLLCELLELPLAKIDATADASDFTIVGGEMLSAAKADGSMFAFRRGPLLTPGAVALVIDELPRLPASASNALLQAMAERRVTVSRTAQKGGSQTVKLSDHLVVLATGNPVSYAGQGERSRALFDRFWIGMLMTQPPDSSRLEMYQKGLVEKQKTAPSPVDWSIDLWTLRRVRRLVSVENNLLTKEQLQSLLAVSHAVSPDDFTSAIGWTCPTYDDFAGRPTMDKRALKQLRELVNANLAEGSNPRGELSALRNAQTLFLMDRDAKVVDDAHLALGFAQANLARLKPFPNCEESVREIICRACQLFFPSMYESKSFGEKVARVVGMARETTDAGLLDRVLGWFTSKG